MIFDELSEMGRHASVHPLMPRAVAFFETLQRGTWPADNVVLDGEALFALPFSGNGIAQASSKLEVHRRYIDIQALFDGQERIGWKPLARCVRPEGPFDEKADCGFFLDEPERWMQLNAGQFLMLWPGETHAPKVSDGFLRKIVVKMLLA